ncbi:MAG: TldD/PmbA family protein [candidate division Zixibacteria bacterium]|nr:TldD/PmbA family protein [candidate division Zixibacteria bacterium]
MKHRLQECIQWLKSRGVAYGDCRYVSQEREHIHVTNRQTDNLARELDAGVGVRVLADGCWGFAATVDRSPSALIKTAAAALEIARASAITRGESVQLAEQEAYIDSYQSPCERDPFEVPLEDKQALLLGVTASLLQERRIKTAEASMSFFRTSKVFASTDGSLIDQQTIESGAGCHAVASDGRDSQTRSTGGTTRGEHATGGYEHVEALNLMARTEQIRDEAAALLKAKSCPAGKVTAILGGHVMAMQIHESCGHPSELDRVLGTEISLAGGSFLTIDQLGKRQYGSEQVNLTADATIPGGLGTFGYDDEGVPAQRVPLVERGIHVGYLTSRETARQLGQQSNGTMRADGWHNMPLIRMTNINLEPGEWELEDMVEDTSRGVFLDTISNVSIDDQRLNFQFSCECAREIKNGRLGQLYKNPLYTGITPRFWGACDAVCNRRHWKMFGVLSCGKGVPMQVMHLGHGAAPARFRDVEIGASR